MTGKLVKFIAIASYTVDRKSYLITAGFLGKSLTYFIAVTVVLVRQYKFCFDTRTIHNHTHPRPVISRGPTTIYGQQIKMISNLQV